MVERLCDANQRHGSRGRDSHSRQAYRTLKAELPLSSRSRQIQPATWSTSTRPVSRSRPGRTIRATQLVQPGPRRLVTAQAEDLLQRCRPQDAHCRSTTRVTHAFECPHRGHRNPSGHRCWTRYARHASSVAKRRSNSASVRGYSSTEKYATYWGHMSQGDSPTGDQYLIHRKDLRTEPNVPYEQHWAPTDGWKTAPHHRSEPGKRYLDRIGHLWDLLAISALRDRHFISAMVGLRSAGSTAVVV